MYTKFKTAVSRDINLLERLSNSDAIEQTAWLTRNLLELLVWVKYCSSSPERAREFWDDSIRDFYSLINQLDYNDPEFLDAVSKAVGLIGTEKEPTAWKRVSKAAKAIGQEGYELYSQMFSKFVHPTAMSVLMRLPVSSRRRIQQKFADQGREFASEALKMLDSSLMAVHYKKFELAIQKTMNSPEGRELDMVL
jgi:hypothetical protein